jgi:hypothetical protein
MLLQENAALFGTSFLRSSPVRIKNPGDIIHGLIIRKIWACPRVGGVGLYAAIPQSAALPSGISAAIPHAKIPIDLSG